MITIIEERLEVMKKRFRSVDDFEVILM